MLRSMFALLASAALAGCLATEPDTDASFREATPESCLAPKVLVCHVPPGNPANAHTICVGAAAVPAHVTHHGDQVGVCACGVAGDACHADDDCCDGECDENGACVSHT